jgi:hypothetical protein
MHEIVHVFFIKIEREFDNYREELSITGTELQPLHLHKKIRKNTTLLD